MFNKFKKRGIPPRHRNSPFMDLAFGKLPVAVFVGGTAPAPLANVTDDNIDTHFTTDGVTSVTATPNTIKIDLGQIYEVYEIRVKNRAGEGFKTNNALNAGTVKLFADTVDGATTQRGTTQTPAGTSFENADIDYIGDGIAVRYVSIQLYPDGTYTLTADLSAIEVFGC